MKNEFKVPKNLEPRLHLVPNPVLEVMAKIMSEDNPHVREQYFDRLTTVQELIGSFLTYYNKK